jgi:hypothetical protein
MATLYDIDLLRALLVNRINDESVFLASFYEQIKGEEAIARYVDELKELIALQNQEKSKSNYKALGIVSQSGNANIVNIKQNYILPFDFQVRFDIELIDRDYVLDKIKSMILASKGRRYELIMLDSGEIIIPNEPQIDTINNKLTIGSAGLSFFQQTGTYDPRTSTTDWINDIDTKYQLTTNYSANFYFIYQGNLYTRTISKISGPSPVSYGTAVDLGLVSNRYKLSLSFNTIQSQEPYITNGLDRVFLFFGGSVTIADENVSLGNDIVRFTIQEGKNTGTTYTIDPTEIPASLAVTDDSYQTWNTGYQTIDRNMTIDNKIRYAFVYDRSIGLFNKLYRYARFGKAVGDVSAIDPNLVYTIKEYRYSFGVLITDTIYAKLGEVQFSNTNGDVMMLNATFKVGAY